MTVKEEKVNSEISVKDVVKAAQRLAVERLGKVVFENVLEEQKEFPGVEGDHFWSATFWLSDEDEEGRGLALTIGSGPMEDIEEGATGENYMLVERYNITVREGSLIEAESIFSWTINLSKMTVTEWREGNNSLKTEGISMEHFQSLLNDMKKAGGLVAARFKLETGTAPYLYPRLQDVKGTGG